LFRQEWVDLPWQWETARSLSAERHYQRGVARAVRVHFLLSDLEDGGCRLLVYFGWVARSGWGMGLLWVINRWMRQQYARVMLGIDVEAVAKRAERELRRNERAEGPEFELNEKRLQRGMADLRERGFEDDELELFAGYLRGASDGEVHRIRPRVLAHEMGTELQPFLRLLLHATRAGLLRLSWDVICPHCRGVRSEARSLGSLREYERCDVCDIDFSATALESVEVTFRLHPELRVVGEVFYCSAEPAKKPHILLQRELGAGERWQSALTTAAGRYRVRTVPGVEGGALVFDLSSGAGGVSVSGVRREVEESGAVEAKFEIDVGDGLRLRNLGEEAVLVVLEDASPDREALRPSELFNLQEFRDLFSEESIAPGLGLEVGHQTLLFTDIVGSSRLYADLGDPEAFKVVRDHFVALNDEVSLRGGAMVKTIGDAMMASFANSEDALRAAVGIQRKFCPGGDARVSLRISIHRGVCIAVKLDSGIDYFGHAVNWAAKMQVAAGAGEIAMSDSFFSLPGIADLVRAEGLDAEPVSFDFPEKTGEHRVFCGRFRAGR
ncbi:MAG: DUF5939 domain-containing protein, partial [Verrucomicrobiales bacterium]|nr:DUF5939 domain-containing protein [Verrucomicrobiales bacterium]